MRRWPDLRFDAALWRRLAYLGSAYGPAPLVRLAPPAIGVAFAAALPGLRDRVRRTLRRVRGRRGALVEHVEVARTVAAFAACLSEGLALGGPRRRDVRPDVRGADHLERALGEGRGIVIVTAHTGGWEAAGPLLARRFGLRTVVLMAKERDAGARAAHDAARERAGVRVVHAGDPLASIDLAGHLRRGGVVAVQIDRAPPGTRTVPVRLFGEPAEVPEGPFRLAAVTGAPMVPVFARRTGFFAYAIEIRPALHLPRRPSAIEIERAAASAAAEMESFLVRYPTQWFHFGPNGPAARDGARSGRPSW